MQELPNNFDAEIAVEVLDGTDIAALQDAFSWGSTPQGYEFWCTEWAHADFENFLASEGIQIDDEDEDDYSAEWAAFKPRGSLSDEAKRAIRGWILQDMGLTDEQLGLKPVGAALAKVVEDLGAKMNAGLDALEAPESDALPSRALRFGQPQIMGGTGQWDNLRYAPNDEDQD